MRVDVNPDVLRWAIERARIWTKDEKNLKNYDEWIKGRKRPTLKQLEGLARSAKIPLGYLFLDSPPKEELPIPLFRTGKGETRKASPGLLEVVRTARRRQVWMREYRVEMGYPPLEFVGSASIKDNPEVVAEDIRRKLGLKKTWAREFKSWEEAYRYLRKKVEDAGIMVSISSIVNNNTRWKLNVEEFRGFVLVDEYAPLVFINANDFKAAQIFTLAHELAHIWLGESAAFDLRELQPSGDELEIACDRIAAEFLVPSETLRRDWKTLQKPDDPFEELAKAYRVSQIVVARRALDLKLITPGEFHSFYETYRSRVRKKENSGGGDFYLRRVMELGRPFSVAVVSTVMSGKILYREAYELTGLYGTKFDRFVEFLKKEGIL